MNVAWPTDSNAPLQGALRKGRLLAGPSRAFCAGAAAPGFSLGAVMCVPRPNCAPRLWARASDSLSGR